MEGGIPEKVKSIPVKHCSKFKTEISTLAACLTQMNLATTAKFLKNYRLALL